MNAIRISALAILALAACDDMTVQPKPRLAQNEPPANMVRWHESTEPAPALTLALMQRGRERFGIYCAPCHGATGDGQGRIVERGFTAPPSYHIARLRKAAPRYFYDVITQGHGAMYSYANRVPPADRWAIVAYIKALQLAATEP